MDKPQFINWVKTQINSIDHFERSALAEKTIADIKKFDPVAAQLYADNTAALNKLKNHLKSRLG